MPLLTEAELKEKLAEAVERLREAFSPVAIYFFGSYAYGSPVPGSDLDLLVVVAESVLDPYSRDTKAYEALRVRPKTPHAGCP